MSDNICTCPRCGRTHGELVPATFNPEMLTDGELVLCLEELRKRDDKLMEFFAPVPAA